MLDQFGVGDKMDIDFLSGLGLDLVEFDERLPSMRFKLYFEVEYLGSCVRYSNESVWIECAIWDQWLKNLKGIKFEKREEAILNDLSHDFVLTLSKKSHNDFELVFCYSINEFKKPITEIRTSFILTSDCVYRLTTSSEDFPIMW